MKLIFVRHGDAYAGLRGVVPGPLGCRGLTDLGRRQATALHDSIAADPNFTVDVLVTSMIPRAIETANIIAPALGFTEVPQDCDLCEVHTGEADGLEWADYTSRFGTVDMLAEPHREFAPGGDSWNSFHHRVGMAMDRFARDHTGATVMAVCHAGVIAAAMRVRFGAQPSGGPRLVPTNTGLTEWDFAEATGEWTLRTYDDARHLAGLPDDGTLEL